MAQQLQCKWVDMFIDLQCDFDSGVAEQDNNIDTGGIGYRTGALQCQASLGKCDIHQ